MLNKEKVATGQTEFFVGCCFGGSFFFLKDTKMHVTEAYIRNIFKNPPLYGSCLNTADICLQCLLGFDVKYGQNDHCGVLYKALQ